MRAMVHHCLARQVTATVPSFEEVALQLVDSGDPAALQTFLLTRLQVLGPQDKAQVRHACSYACCHLDRLR